MNYKTGKVHSSHGTFIIDLNNGRVISSSDIDDSFGTIPIKFDLEEYHNAYPGMTNESEFDILDIGYWLPNKVSGFDVLDIDQLPDISYVQPDSGFRKMTAIPKKYEIKAIYVDTEEKLDPDILSKLNEELSKAGVNAEDIINIESTDNYWLVAYYKAFV